MFYCFVPVCPLSSGRLFTDGCREMLILFSMGISPVSAAKFQGFTCPLAQRFGHLPATLRRWLGFPQQPAGVRCPDCPQGRSASIPQAPSKSSRKKPKTARTRCPAGSSTLESNPLLPEGTQKPLLLLAASWKLLMSPACLQMCLPHTPRPFQTGWVCWVLVWFTQILWESFSHQLAPKFPY